MIVYRRLGIGHQRGILAQLTYDLAVNYFTYLQKYSSPIFRYLEAKRGNRKCFTGS